MQVDPIKPTLKVEIAWNRPIPLYESTNSVVYDSRTEMTVTLRALRQ